MSDSVAGTRAAGVRRMTFDNNALLAVLYGNHDRNLVRIEQLANVQLSARGNQLAISGTPDDAAVAQKAISGLYERLKRGLSIEGADIDAAVRFARSGPEGGDAENIRTRKRTVQAARPASVAISRPCASVTWCLRWDRPAAARPISRSPWAFRCCWPARSSASCCRVRPSRPASAWASCPAT